MRCKLCNNKKLSEFVDLGMQPLANKYPKNNQEIKKEKKYHLKVLFCYKCKSAQIKKIISRQTMFKDYYYLSSVNQGLVKHFESLAKKLKKSNFVLDIGSNDGILLKPLKRLGVKAIGIDPAENVGKIANDRGLTTIIDFFNYKSVKKITKEFSKPDFIVASSIFTHLENPINFVKNIKILLKDKGTFILEIEYLINIIKNLEYERFYFDRPFYYSLNSINALFNSIGMYLVDVEFINIHGGSIRCFIKKNKKNKMSNRCLKILKNETKFLNNNTLKKFNKKILEESNKFKNRLINYKNQSKKIIGYGAPARVATITNFSNINGELIEYLIDDSKLKQGKFSPGKHIKILSRKKMYKSKIDIVIVFAYEYFSEIKKKFKSNKIKFFKPIPFLPLKK